MMKIPYIFDIKRSSTNDGDGLRTVIFFKGCNLDCYWCHNPESKNALPQLAFFEEKCEGCGSCQRICTRGENTCAVCGRCVSVCPASARRIYGRIYTVESLVDVIVADKAYYDATDGGVTFSGGECMLYPEFVASLARKCKENSISVAIDTAGCVPYSNFELVLPYVDMFLYDVKCIDSNLHKQGTGRENHLILQNLERLMNTGKRILIRTPVIPNFNDNTEIERIKCFCEDKGLTLELLPYHSYGESKKKAIE